MCYTAFLAGIHAESDIVSSHMVSGRGDPTRAFLTETCVSLLNETILVCYICLYDCI